eukprot:TRINITY_DN7542_c0_g1_i1.p1 TRINITY_DN7542_c0_g1~~TRINITY_DN7542_c0_g1_i1.p1  ORF type:complete len:474 (+),score=65.18 TRINITY_DN7542_c0_g1_i1:47-1468(+)
MQSINRKFPVYMLIATFVALVFYSLSSAQAAQSAASQRVLIRQHHDKSLAEHIADRSVELHEQLWTPIGIAYDTATDGKPVEQTRSNTVLSQDHISIAKRVWHTYLGLVPRYAIVSHLFSGRGIVISGGAYQVQLAYACIKMIRQHGCTLPIDFWISSGRNESLTPTALRLLKSLDVHVYDTDAVAATFDEMSRQMHPTNRRTKPYILKQIALVSSRCRECLLLDADNIPTMDPTFLFETQSYKKTGHLMWPDFWHMRSGPAAIRAIFDLPQGTGDLPDTRSVESGQMVIDKQRAWQTLLLSVFIQVQTEFYDNLMRQLHHLGGGGDKQTFLIGCLATNSTCDIVRHPVASAGRLMSGTYCGRTMIQHSPNGSVLFVHANMDKERYYKEMLAADEWDEGLRRNDIIRQPKGEGSWSVSFVHQQACEGGGWVVQINSDMNESRLRDHVSFDFERRKWQFVKEYDRLTHAFTTNS